MPQRHLIRGFHGTTASVARTILSSGRITISRNDYDWLGRGSYFFQDAPLRAWKWSHHWVAPRARDLPAVIAADISLEHCFDLLDLANWRYLLRARQLRPAGLTQRPPVVRDPASQRFHIISPAPVAGIPGLNFVDCAVVKLAVRLLRRQGKTIHSVRGAFIEGQQLYDNSYFFDHSHVQIAVLDPTAIVPGSLASLDTNALASVYNLSGMTRWPV